MTHASITSVRNLAASMVGAPDLVELELVPTMLTFAVDFTEVRYDTTLGSTGSGCSVEEPFVVVHEVNAPPDIAAMSTTASAFDYDLESRVEAGALVTAFSDLTLALELDHNAPCLFSQVFTANFPGAGDLGALQIDSYDSPSLPVVTSELRLEQVVIRSFSLNSNSFGEFDVEIAVAFARIAWTATEIVAPGVPGGTLTQRWDIPHR